MAASDQHHRALPDWSNFFETFPIPVQIYQHTGDLVTFNDASARMWGMPDNLDATAQTFNMLKDPQLVAAGIPALFHRVLEGETISSPPHLFDTAQVGMQGEAVRRRWVESTYFPLRDEAGTIMHVGLIHRDVTDAMEQARATEEAERKLNEQRDTILELSSPVMKVWEGIIAMPLVGVIDTRRATTITETLLEAIVAHQATHVILDISGVAMVDTQVANYLLLAARACRLLGSQVILVGVRSEIARVIVHLGIELDSFVTCADLQAGIAWAFQRQGLAVNVNGEPG